MADLAKQTSEAFGDIEFEASLGEFLDKDPVAALGFDPANIKFNIPQGDKYGTKYLREEDVIHYGPDTGSSKDIIIHEFRHRGHQLLRNEIEKNPQAFVEKYGQDVVDFLTGKFSETTGIPYSGDRHEEFRTELGDNIEATFVKPRPTREQFLEQMKDALGDSADLFTEEELVNLGVKNYVKNVDNIGYLKDKTELVTKEDQEKYKNILTKVRQAASDLIKERRGYAEGGVSMLPAVDDDTRSTEEYLEANKPMDISSVPSFKRPMDASDNDPLVGEDDAGNPVYRTMLGNTYTVRRNPDQRTTRTRIEEDVLPAVRNYLADPTAPTADQAIAAAKAIAGDAWETISIPGDLLSGEKGASDVTLGQVFELTGGTAAASTMFDVPGGRDTLRIFGSVRMKGAAKDKNLKKAIKLAEKTGVPNQGAIPEDVNRDIWSKTGWFVNPDDGQWRFHIDDSNSTLNSFDEVFKTQGKTSFEALSKANLPIEKARPVEMSRVLNHENLYQRYPEFKNEKVYFFVDTSEDGKKLLGSVRNNKLYINLGGEKFKNFEDIQSVLLHELQHKVQRREGLIRGASAEQIPEELVVKRDKEISNLKAPIVKEKEKLENELNAIENRLREEIRNAETPIPGLTAQQEIEIWKKKPYNPEKMDHDGPSWAALGREYGVKPAVIQKAWGRVNIQDHLRSEQQKLNLAILNKDSEIYALNQESFDIETNFYEGAGGEIEARLVQKMFDDPSIRLQMEKLKKAGLADFPLDIQKEMLQSERTKVFDYSGDQGVDPIKYEVEPRRVPEQPSFLSNVKSKLGFSEDSVIPSNTKKVFRGHKKGESVNANVDSEGFTFYTDDKKTADSYASTFKDEGTVSEAEVDLGNSLKGSPVEVREALGLEPSASFEELASKAKENGYDSVEVLRNQKGDRPFSEYLVFNEQKPEITLKDFGYYVDNPAKWGNTDWAKQKQAVAEKYAREGGKSAQKLLSGPQTAFLGIDNKKPLYLDTEFLSTLKGANDEVTDMSNPKYVDLKESVEKEGFVPDQKGNKILIGINHKGEAFIMEGNNRVAIAKEFGAPSVKAEVRYYNGAEEVDGPYSPQNILKYASQAPKQFAEGGAVGNMNRQMELFARGGLKDDGMNMDPVSGNEVPSGSLAKEVRDDIPAQLSEGEYVVPADVVRYYGVKFFEDLRDQAKMGLTEMEADGRIGGEPVMDQGITEEDLAALDQMLTTGAYNGGLMDKLEYAAKNDPVVNQRLNRGGMVVGFAEGGMTQSLYSDPTQIDMVINKVMAAARQNPEIMKQLSARGIQINRTEPQMPPQQMNQANPPQEARQAMAVGGPVVPMPGVPGPNAPMEQRTSYITSPTTVNPVYTVPGASYSYAEDGALPTPKPQEPVASPEYCNSIGMMFDPTTNACVPKPQAQTSDDDGAPAVQAPKWFEKYDYTDPTSVYQKSMNMLGYTEEDEKEEAKAEGLLGTIGGKIGEALGGIFEGGMLGGVIKQQKAAEAMANAALLDAMGYEDEAEKLKNQVAAYRDANDLKTDGFFDSTKTLTRQLADARGMIFNEETGTISRIGGTGAVTPVDKPAPTTTTPSSSGDDDDNGPVFEKPTEPTPSSGPSYGYNYTTTDEGQTATPTITSPGGTAGAGGGQTGSDTRPDDPRGEGQYGGPSTSSSSSGVSPTGDDIEGTPFYKGGLMKRPKR